MLRGSAGAVAAVVGVSSNKEKEAGEVSRVFPNGDSYQGQWAGGVPHGSGIYRWSDGSVYEGEFVKGTKHGRGAFVWPSGAKYWGEWIGGQMQGVGTYWGVDESFYTGNWARGLKHGLGRKRYPNQDSYEGFWSYGAAEGTGRYQWVNGNEYIGDWSGGTMSGYGTFKWASSDVYEGEWESGFEHGHGLFIWQDGSMYEGTWSHGLLDGKGIYYPAGCKKQNVVSPSLGAVTPNSEPGSSSGGEGEPVRGPLSSTSTFTSGSPSTRTESEDGDGGNQSDAPHLSMRNMFDAVLAAQGAGRRWRAAIGNKEDAKKRVEKFLSDLEKGKDLWAERLRPEYPEFRSGPLLGRAVLLPTELEVMQGLGEEKFGGSRRLREKWKGDIFGHGEVGTGKAQIVEAETEAGNHLPRVKEEQEGAEASTPMGGGEASNTSASQDVSEGGEGNYQEASVTGDGLNRTGSYRTESLASDVASAGSTPLVTPTGGPRTPGSGLGLGLESGLGTSGEGGRFRSASERREEAGKVANGEVLPDVVAASPSATSHSKLDFRATVLSHLVTGSTSREEDNSAESQMSPGPGRGGAGSFPSTPGAASRRPRLPISKSEGGGGFLDRPSDGGGLRGTSQSGIKLSGTLFGQNGPPPAAPAATNCVMVREYVHGILVSETPRDSKSTSIPKRRGPKRESKKAGETIYKGHRSYDLMLTLQLGISYSVGRVNQESERELRDSDFGGAAITVRFPAAGSQVTPPHNMQSFRWKDYCPHVFRNLRNLFGVDPLEYLNSLSGLDALRELSSPGKSGSMFYLSNDDNFIIKTMKKAEVDVLVKMLPAYHRHVQAHPNTLLTRFFGLHRVKIHHGHKVRFVVMGNLLKCDLPVHRRFDLKGSSQGRSTDKIEIDETTTLKDLDLDLAFHLHNSQRHVLQEQIEADCNFLEEQRIMDYSLLLGLHFKATAPPPPVVKISETRPEEGGAESSPVAPAISEQAENDGLEQNPEELDLANGAATAEDKGPPSIYKSFFRWNGRKPVSSTPQGTGSTESTSGPSSPPGSDQAPGGTIGANPADGVPPGSGMRKSPSFSSLTGGAIKSTLAKGAPPGSGVKKSASAHALPGGAVKTIPGVGVVRKMGDLGQGMAATAVRLDRRTRRPITDSQAAEAYEVVLYFGIIDILQVYDIGKKLEHFYKAMQYDGNSISAVEPKLYARRFQEFAETTFVDL